MRYTPTEYRLVIIRLGVGNQGGPGENENAPCQ